MAQAVNICCTCHEAFPNNQGQLVGVFSASGVSINSLPKKQVFVCHTCFNQTFKGTALVIDCGLPKPIIKANIDLDALKRTCQSYIDSLDVKGWADEDYHHYIFEEAMTALFGPDIFKWVNAKKG